MTIASIRLDIYIEGGVKFLPPQAQELQKSPGGIGVNKIRK